MVDVVLKIDHATRVICTSEEDVLGMLDFFSRYGLRWASGNEITVDQNTISDILYYVKHGTFNYVYFCLPEDPCGDCIYYGHYDVDEVDREDDESYIYYNDFISDAIALEEYKIIDEPLDIESLFD